jgi:hypothetical protein
MGDREAEMTYRDDKLYRRIRVERAQFPIASLMTHGIIRGLLDGTAPKESIADWSDYVTMFFGRGTKLQELYVSPSLMPDPFWQVLGKAIRWARKHEQTLRHSVMIGGSPGAGEPYGYAHWSEEMGIFVIRNPTITPVSFILDWSSRPSDMSFIGDWKPVIVYPIQERLGDIRAREPLVLKLPGRSVTVLHLYSKLPEVIASIPLGRFDLALSESPPTLTLLSPPQDGSIQTLGEIVDERETWEGIFNISSRAGGDLTVECRPAKGVSIDVEGASEVERRGLNLWELVRYRWTGSDSPIPLHVHMTLPPTPLWPVKSRVRVVARMRTDLAPQEERSLSLGVESPEWPLVLQPRVFLSERLLAEEKSFTRGRNVLESVGWFLLLVILPITIIQTCTTRLLRYIPTYYAWGLRFLIAIGVASVYLLTHLGRWLIQTLEG